MKIEVGQYWKVIDSKSPYINHIIKISAFLENGMVEVHGHSNKLFTDYTIDELLRHYKPYKAYNTPLWKVLNA